MKTLKIGIFASHGGSSMRAILEAVINGTLNAKICVVISNNADATALKIANENGIPSMHLSQTKLGDDQNLDEVIVNVLTEYGCELIVLSGYLRKFGPKTLDCFQNRILNIHPSLLPKYGGQGMFGKYVHEAVLAAGEKESGASIHWVDKNYDSGDILDQRAVPIFKNDTPSDLAKRIEAIEPDFFVESLQRLTLPVK